MWAEDLNRHLTKETYTYGKEACRKMFQSCHQRNWNNEVPTYYVQDTAHVLEWPKSRRLATPNAGKKVEQEELSFIAGGNEKWYSHFGNSLRVEGFFKKWNIVLPYQPVIVHLGLYPQDLKAYVHTKICL